MTVKDWLETWVDVWTIDIKDSTRAEYKKIIDTRIIAHKISKIQLQKLTQTDVQSFINDLGKSGRLSAKENPKVLSARSVEFTHTILSAALSKAAGLDLIPKNPAIKYIKNKRDGIKLPTIIKKDVEIFVSGQCKGTFQKCVKC